MAKRLCGIDVSRHNRNMQNMRDINAYDFVIMKATEGRSYKDQSLPIWLAYLDDDTLKGLYHFCRADLGTSPVEEAENFLKYTEYMIDGQTALFLDVEGHALLQKNIDEWCAVWCEYVYNKTGIKPLIYTGYAFLKKFKKCAEYGCGLWLAKWGPKPKEVKPWEFWAFWQYTSDGIVSGVRCDLDYFNGSREQYLKYCEVMRNDKSEDSDSAGDK